MTFPTSRMVLLLSGWIQFAIAVPVVGNGQETGSRTMWDVEGNAYRTIQIGNQWWLAENLNVSRYANGDSIPEVQNPEEWVALTTGAWCFYDNDPRNGEKYGKLYNWYAVNDPRGLAPDGWHVPTEEEWVELEVGLGMNPPVGDTEGWSGTTQGTRLKSSGGWEGNGNGTDSVGFSALPAGFRGLEGSFYQMGNMTSFWSSSYDAWDYVWYRALAADQSGIRRKLGTKMRGFSVRLVKDSGR
jgi:uncharacterized protein (TIGR02145 family)